MCQCNALDEFEILLQRENGPFPASFSLFLYFQTVESKLVFNTNFDVDCIQTVDLWCLKRPLYQLSHNHCPLYEICHLTLLKFFEFKNL